ncbi:disulfide bond formation protein [Streptococcus oralis]|uniref:disulfide bond formation protein n=1 Tax=Streptococcus oralis TaxID=1303 RepID=UPI003EE303EC
MIYQEYEEIIKRLINLEYPSQKRYPGVIQDIYKLAERIGRGETMDEVSFFGLARRFVDETMDYKSDILVVLKQLEKELKKENDRKEKTL